MIPVSLRLRNFISYGEDVPPLDFTGFRMCCLTGSNGNGKSALLDAITWALWGQARGVDKSGAGMDELVRLGADEMEVEFSFLLEGNLYRVVRKRDKRRGMSALELQVADDQTFRSLSGDKLAATQDKILQILKIDYETFVNSAFVLQGKADTFTQQKPNERKRILGEILGLSFYDQLERKARDKMNLFDQMVKVLDQELSKLEEVLSGKAEHRRQLDELTRQLKVLNGEILQEENRVIRLREGKKELDEVRQRLAELAQRFQQGTLEIERLDFNIRQYQERIKQYLDVLQEKDAILAGYQQYQEAGRLHNEYSAKAARLMNLNEQKSSLEKKLAQEQQKLEKQLSTLQAEIKQYQEQVGDMAVKKEELAALKQEMSILISLEKEKKNLEEEDKLLEKELASYDGNLAAHKRNLKDLRARYTQIKQLKKCPFCATQMNSAVDLERVVRNFSREAENLKKEMEVLEDIIKQTRTRQQIVQKNLMNIMTKLQHKEQVQSRLVIAEQDWKRGLTAEKLLQERLELIQEVERSLLEIAATSEDRKALGEIEKEIIDLNYNREEHLTVQKRLLELESNERGYRELIMAEQGLKQDREHLEHLQENLEQRSKALHNEKELQKFYSIKEQELAGLVPVLAEVEGKLNGLRSQRSSLEEARGVVLERYNRCLALEEERKEKQIQREKGALEKSYYAELVEAFGRKGIQAVIIENAIPELQDEANRFLTKMTDGRLMVELVTQKGNKRGNIVETLDIEISDELGKRKYEMYSGGEAFRVNFAIRLSLSRLLARRAGAKLQTLVIDEGFGTQDDQGKERLIEVINAIQDEFEKIIVITHIRELKDAFPVRIEVTKTDQGSQVIIL